MTPRTDELLEQGADALDAGNETHARDLLEQAVELDPDDADVRHLLALAYSALGDEKRVRDQFLLVRQLDARNDDAAGPIDPALLDLMRDITVRVIESLPKRFREPLRNVPVFLEPRPSVALVEEGFDPRALGVFEGPRAFDDNTAALTRIVIFTDNLLAETRDEEELRREVEVTVLHEVGHYFGLEEDDLERLGLG